MEQLYGQFHYDFEEQQDVNSINAQFKSLITADITQTEIDEVSRKLNRDAQQNSRVVIENERA